MTKYDALLILKGKTDMLNELVDIVAKGVTFKEAAKISLEKLREETALIEKWP